MSTYEEMVVDRSVEAAWLKFRVRLADHLAAMTDDDELVLTVDRAAGAKAIRLRISIGEADTVRLTVRFRLDGDRTAERKLQVTRQMAEIGLTACNLVLGREQVDRMACAAERILREVFVIVHPSFVDVSLGDLVLVDPPEQLVSTPAKPGLPEVITVHAQEELQGWVDRALEPEFGHAPRKDDRGNIWVNRGDHRLVIRVSSTRPIVDLTAVLARDVDIRKARKQVHKLNDKFYFLRFFVSGDRLMMATTVSAKPFAPAHLVDAMNMMLSHLESRSPRLQAKLARTEPPVQEARPGIDPDLLLVFGAAGDRRAMVALARELSTDDRSTLASWRAQARTAESAAKAQAAGRDHGPAQNALIDAVVAWHAVVDALSDALREQGAAA